MWLAQGYYGYCVHCSLVNFGGRSELGGCEGDTSPVGNYPSGASPYGALDMAGNVWEWVSDWYQSDYYSASPYRNPQGPASGSDKVVRGGSWNNATGFLRSAYRWRDNPIGGNYYRGSRCAVSPGG